MVQKIRTILIAEDSDDEFAVFSLALNKCVKNASLCRVKDGVEAIDYLAGARDYADRHIYPIPGLLLLDLKLPRKDGLEVLQWIRGQSTFQNLLVIALTSSSDPQDVRRAHELGVNSYLAKPTNFDFYCDLTRSMTEYWVNWNEPARFG